MKKNYTWLISIGNANTNNDKDKLHAYFKLGSKLIVSLWLVLGLTAIHLNAQTPIWTSLGPNNMNTANNGIITALCEKPNSNTIYIGTRAGGFWEGIYNNTTNQYDWSPKINTTEKHALGVLSIAVSNIQNNGNNIIYATFSNSPHITYFDQVFDRAGGLCKSIDGGNTWTTIISNETEEQYINKVVLDPNDNNKLVAIGNNKIYRTIDGGENWDTYTPAITVSTNTNAPIGFLDIDICPGNSNLIYACTNGQGNQQAEVWKIDLSLTSPVWSKITTLTDIGFRKVQIDFSNLEPNNVFIMYSDNTNTNNTNMKIKKSNDNGSSWITLESLYIDNSDWGGSKYGFEMSESNINYKYIGGDVLYRINNSHIKEVITMYSAPQGIHSTHADIRAI